MNKISTSTNEKILSTVYSKLKPKLSHLIGKVFLVHMITGVLTLTVCPQFGFKLLKLPINLMHTFMVFGLPICNFLCGVFFTATSIMVAAIVLNRDEIRALRHHQVLTCAALVLSSIGFFGIMDPTIFLEFSIAWLLGALLGVLLTLRVSSRILARA